MKLEIIFEDKYFIAINKPHGLLVHRTEIATDVKIFAIQSLRNQIGQRVYPAHRLDRKTSGVLLFAKSQELYKLLQKQFATKQIHKKYIAIVRGYTEKQGEINYSLFNEDLQKHQEAVTFYKTKAFSELNIKIQKQHSTSRYSLVEAIPSTGRMHQIRKHFKHLRHPIIGDRPYGCNKQNRFFKQNWNIDTMFLHAQELRFSHPITSEILSIKAYPSASFIWAMQLMNWQEALLN